MPYVKRWLCRYAGALMLAALLLASSTPVDAQAPVILVSLDDPGTGSDDPTPVEPVGGNLGTTLGEQRTIVLQTALEQWGRLVGNTVPIVALVTFTDLPCDAAAGAAVLAAAGPTLVMSDFPGARPNTWYPSALADEIAGFELLPQPFDQASDGDLIIFVNGALDNGCLGPGMGFYYGLDHHESPTQIDLLTVLMHEVAHGLGFWTPTDEQTGLFFSGSPSIYDVFVLDTSTGKHWDEMTNVERAASAVNTGNLVWAGPLATAQAPTVLGPPPTLNVTFPEEIAGLYAATGASFGPPVPHMGTEGVIELADDGVAPGTDACEALQNSFEGRIALIDRGNCMYTDKVANAEAAGASAVILVNNDPGPPTGVSGTDPDISIPSIMISQSEGELIRAVGNVHAILQLDDTRLSGVDDNGSIRLFAPNPLQPGSSVSHWDTGATPSLLMEPNITPDLAPLRDVDLTLALLADMGWIVPPSDGVMTLSPPSGTYLASQTIDLSVVLDTPEPAIESLQVLLNEADATDTIGSCLLANSGVLATGGLSLRCPNVNSSIAVGTTHLTLSMRLPDGSRHTAAATWTILGNEE
jgi:PA domain